MNYLLIIVLAILIIGVITGIVRGLTNMIFETATTLVSIIIASVLCSPIAKAIMSNAGMMAKLTEKIKTGLKLDELASKAANADDLFNKVSLPSVITDKVAKTISDGAQATAEAAATGIAAFVSKIIIYVACFLVLFILAVIALHILDGIFDLINKLPGIKQTNKLLGAVLGLVLALMVVWIFFAVVTLFSSTGFGAAMLAKITESRFLSFIYNNNIPMQIITKKVEGLF